MMQCDIGLLQTRDRTCSTSAAPSNGRCRCKAKTAGPRGRTGRQRKVHLYQQDQLRRGACLCPRFAWHRGDLAPEEFSYKTALTSPSTSHGLEPTDSAFIEAFNSKLRSECVTPTSSCRPKILATTWAAGVDTITKSDRTAPAGVPGICWQSRPARPAPRTRAWRKTLDPSGPRFVSRAQWANSNQIWRKLRGSDHLLPLLPLQGICLTNPRNP